MIPTFSRFMDCCDTDNCDTDNCDPLAIEARYNHRPGNRKGGGAARLLGVGGVGVTLTQGGQSAWVELLKKVGGKNGSLTGCSATLSYKNKSLNAKMSINVAVLHC